MNDRSPIQGVHPLLAFLVVCSLILGGCVTPPAPLTSTPLVPEPTPEPAAAPVTAAPAPTAAPPTATSATVETPSGSCVFDESILALLELMNKTGDFDLWLAALEATGYADVLKGAGEYTVFAPTDQAFRAFATLQMGLTFDDQTEDATLFKDMMSQLGLLKKIVAYQIVPGQAIAGLHEREPIETLEEREAVIMRLAKVNNAHILAPGACATNGIVYVTDAVLAPVAFDTPVILAPNAVWEPFPPGIVPPIGDAELVPGAPVMLKAIESLGGVLKENNATQINIARTVRLEENGETVYLAPVGSESWPEDPKAFQGQAAHGGVVIGTIVFEELSRGSSELSSEHYVQRVKWIGEDKWQMEYIDAEGKSGPPEDVTYLEVEKVVEGPVSGICYGTKWCCTHKNGQAYCKSCKHGPYETKSECKAACQ